MACLVGLTPGQPEHSFLLMRGIGHARLADTYPIFDFPVVWIFLPRYDKVLVDPMGVFSYLPDMD
jgi:hypothetical protein